YVAHHVARIELDAGTPVDDAHMAEVERLRSDEGGAVGEREQSLAFEVERGCRGRDEHEGERERSEAGDERKGRAVVVAKSRPRPPRAHGDPAKRETCSVATESIGTPSGTSTPSVGGKNGNGATTETVTVTKPRRVRH